MKILCIIDCQNDFITGSLGSPEAQAIVPKVVDKIRKFKDENIVTDRHLASNYAWSGTEDNSDVYDLLVKKLGAPKLTVILYSPSDVIVERLKNRNKTDKDIERAKQSEEIYKRMIEFCKKYNFNYVLIDSSKLNAEEVTNKILELVK